ncbi:hypothetical protein FGB62_103g015 [Gracilaria domingensis]|nr:hypothetical protein FGB62_103g015 [Gracilaria domingensis]
MLGATKAAPGSLLTSQAMESALAASNPSALVAAAELGAQLTQIGSSVLPSTSGFGTGSKAEMNRESFDILPQRLKCAPERASNRVENYREQCGSLRVYQKTTMLQGRFDHLCVKPSEGSAFAYPKAYLCQPAYEVRSCPVHSPPQLSFQPFS